MGELVHVISLPQSNSKDVLAREIHIVVNGVERVVKISPDVVNFKVPAKHGDQVSVFVVDIDDTGNLSEPSESLDWLVVDTVAPRRPERPVLVSVEEDVVEDSLEEVVEHVEHEHCSESPCEKEHEHCGQHEHCSESPCEKEHEHCGEECVEPCQPCVEG